VSKTRTIKNSHAMGVRCKVNETAGFEIFYLCAISLNQQERLPGSAFDVVQAHAIDIDGGSISVARGLMGQVPMWRLR
jgi:hypothetical protein